MSKKKQKMPKVRNEFVVGMINRGGQGAHGKTKKAERTAAKVELKKYKHGDSDEI